MREALAAAVVACALISAPARGDEVKIDHLVVAEAIPDAQRDAQIEAARAFYQF